MSGPATSDSSRDELASAGRRTVPPFASVRGWSLILALLLMGVALLVSAWLNDRGVKRASQTLVRGQGDVLHDGIRRRMIELGRPMSSAELVVILGDFRDEGLRYVATLDAAGRIVAESGDATETRAAIEQGLASSTPGEPVGVGSRVRIYFGMFRARAGKPLDPSRTPWVIEYDPRMATALRDTARWTFGVGALSAAGLLILAIVLVRRQLRRQALERALAQERRLATLGEMSAVLAHEIRNPLASLKGNGQVLVRLLPDDDQPRRMAERMVSETVRLEQLTNDLLEFARSGEIHRRDVDPVEIARAVASALGDERVQVSATDAPRRWSLDPERIRQVLTNLLDNAVQESELPVQVEVAEREGQLEFVVRDHGAGIASGELERVFEPFYTGRINGTGLGLAVARRLIRLHGGELSAANVEASAGGGAVFRATIPKE